MGHNNRLTQLIFTVGDRRTPIAGALKDSAGTAIDLAGHSVAFRMVDAVNFAPKVSDAPATIDTAASGEVHYDWAAADTDTPGDYWAWFVITRTSDGKREHFPGDGDRLKVTFVPAR